MANMLASLAGQASGGLINGVTDGIARIVGLFKISPEVAAANAIEIQKIQAAMIDSAQKAAQAQIDDATANIQAEAKAGSKARPMFMYIIEIVLVFDLVFAPLWNGFCKSNPITALPLPSNLLILFGVCLTGYTAFDKVQQIMNLPGESTLQLPGVKVVNRSN